MSFRSKVTSKFTLKINNIPKNKGNKDNENTASVSRLSPPIPAKSSKEVKDITKFFKKIKNSKEKENMKKSYAQASFSDNIARKVLKIKEVFSNLQEKKIENIQKIINRDDKLKPRLNITTKRPSHKQVIIPINSDNMGKFMANSSNHIININRLLKNIKSECKVDYIRSEKSDITIVTDKVASALDLQNIEKYVKNANQINAESVQAPRLPQSKSYLKIIGLPYLIENMNVPLNSEVVEKILKNNHIFNNILLTSRPRIIKISPKSDMAIVWLDIWDLQSSSNTKGLINKCFNFGSFIITICRANMNSSVPQCKKCWKWGHGMQSCRVQGSKCIKCNSPHMCYDLSSVLSKRHTLVLNNTSKLNRVPKYKMSTLYTNY